MNQRQQNVKKDGFTIIEVVLVLAIAGLIFLMVFIALPNLQRGQRDTQRRSDLTRITTQLQNYQSSNRGAIPTAAVMTANATGFVTKYLEGGGAVAGNSYADPSTGVGYTISTTTSSPALGTIYYQLDALCGPDGVPGTTTSATLGNVDPTPRNYVLITKLESQSAPFCIDNR